LKVWSLLRVETSFWWNDEITQFYNLIVTQGHTDIVWSLSFSREGTLLATG
jgi:hypothetical protein